MLRMNKIKYNLDNLENIPKYNLYENFHSEISKWLREQKVKEIEAMRFKFNRRKPEIGDRCLIYQGIGMPVYFGYRSSKNWYNSGEWRIRVDTEGLVVVTIEEIK